MPIISQPRFFNLTSNFRSDSDFHLKYVYYRQKTNITAGNTVKKESVLSKKKKLMAWFVSHCVTDGKREDYLEELRKYIPVDIFGECGKRKDCRSGRKKNCINVSLEEYKFYFAAENTICKEYFTGTQVSPHNYQLPITTRGMIVVVIGIGIGIGIVDKS